MIKIENTDVHGFEAAIRGMRNPMNSLEKSDSEYKLTNPEDVEFGYNDNWNFVIGENDLSLMKQLVKAGSDHSKFMRMITVSCDITAPQFWVAELDTYKIATVRNSCSFQHKGVSKPFSIRDFSVSSEIYDILDPIRGKREHSLVYPQCKSDEFKIYVVGDREYKVYKNGKVFACAFERVHEKDNRVRHFKEREVMPSKTAAGYYEMNIGGRKYLEKWLLHSLVAEVWMSDSYFSGAEINHKDGNKGNNAVENLEWCTHSENEIHKHKNGLDGRTLHTDYIAWKNGKKYDNSERRLILEDRKAGMTYRDISEKHGISLSGTFAICNHHGCENARLFELAEMWESVIGELNRLRELYLATGDYSYFIDIRQLIPMGYNYRFTWQANYAVLRNIYHARKNHKLDEWREFCAFVESLPYSKLITYSKEDENNE